MPNAIENKARELAATVIPAGRLASFLALPLADRLTGIATLAHIGGDLAVRDAALAAHASLEAV